MGTAPTRFCPKAAFPRQIRQAFTLIEMILVMVILAAITGALAVSWTGAEDRHKLRAAAKDLAAAIRFSASEARLRQLPHRVTFNETFTAYRVEKAVSRDGRRFEPARGQGGRLKALVESIRIESTSADGHALKPLPEALVYDACGSGFHGEIRLRNRRGEDVGIRVTSTGQVHVAE